MSTGAPDEGPQFAPPPPSVDACMQNLLLRRFPPEVINFLGPHLRRVSLAADVTLHSAHQAAPLAYFPTTAVVAVRHDLTPNQSQMLALIDRRGMVGSSIFLGPDATIAVVLLAGEAVRLEAGHLRAEFDRHASVRLLLLGWIQAYMTQVVQASACQRYHPPLQRLCLRLAQLSEGRPDHRIRLTQSQLAEVLGTRRERVNELMGQLLDSGTVVQHRGYIELIDQRAVAAQSCECGRMWSDALARVSLQER